MLNIAQTITGHVREAEHYKRQASKARTLHGVREAAGSACNVANNLVSVPPGDMTRSAMQAAGLTEGIASDMASLHRIAADAAGIARARYREAGEFVTAGFFETVRDRHVKTAAEWSTLVKFLMEV